MNREAIQQIAINHGAALGILFAIALPGCSSAQSPTDAVAPQPHASSDYPPSRVDLRAPARSSVLGDPAADQPWAKADERVHRLDPTAFPQLPVAVAAELRRLGCTVPQSDYAKEPHNVITGRFLSAENLDWAVLCSRQRVSAILVFPNGTAEQVVTIESSPDRQWLQGTGGDNAVFSQAISVADAEYIGAHYEQYGGPKPPPLDHDGINHMYIDKASTVLYWYRGEWLRLQGAD